MIQEKSTQTTFVMVPQDEWEDYKAVLLEIKGRVFEKSAEDFSNEILTSEEARKLLGVSHRTWQNYRSQHRINFSKSGRKIFVKRSDIMEFLSNNLIKRRIA